MRKSQGTTVVGYINRNQQVNLGFDNPNGTDHDQSVYALKCGRVKPDGSTDIFQAKCPRCQGGNENLPLAKSYI